jgi:hypothetical protein
MVDILLKFNNNLIQFVLDRIIFIQGRQYKNLSLISTKLITSTSSRRITRTLIPKD